MHSPLNDIRFNPITASVLAQAVADCLRPRLRRRDVQFAAVSATVGILRAKGETELGRAPGKLRAKRGASNVASTAVAPAIRSGLYFYILHAQHFDPIEGALPR
jgi:hypothetical protein